LADDQQQRQKGELGSHHPLPSTRLLALRKSLHRAASNLVERALIYPGLEDVVAATDARLTFQR
jgi:hypothetical protein